MTFALLFIKSHSNPTMEIEFTQHSGVLQTTTFPALCGSVFLFFMPLCFPDVSFHILYFKHCIYLLKVCVRVFTCMSVCVGCYLVDLSGCEEAVALGQRQTQWGEKREEYKNTMGNSLLHVKLNYLNIYVSVSVFLVISFNVLIFFFNYFLEQLWALRNHISSNLGISVSCALLSSVHDSWYCLSHFLKYKKKY